MNIKVLVSGSAAIAAGLILYALHSPVHIERTQQAVVKQPDTASALSQAPAVKRDSYTLQATGEYSTNDKHEHDTQPLPADLAAAIESKRKPASELTLNPVAGGYNMATRGQFQTVVMAFIGEDGKLHRAERQVMPIPDATIAVPPPAPAVPESNQ